MRSTNRALSVFNAKVVASVDPAKAGGSKPSAGTAKSFNRGSGKGPRGDSPAQGLAGATARFPRRDLVAILAYLSRERSHAKCVDGTANWRVIDLARLAAAARMQ